METLEKKEEAMKMPEPTKEHRWLQKLVGEWTSEGEAPHEFKGTETVRSIGDVWVLAEGQGDMPGCGTATSLMTLGYDTQQKRFTGTWIGSMMTRLWVYDGELDAEETSLTLESEGPSMEDDGKMALYRDVIEFRSDDHRVLKALVLATDGQWRQFMTTHYRRK